MLSVHYKSSSCAGVPSPLLIQSFSVLSCYCAVVNCCSYSSTYCYVRVVCLGISSVFVKPLYLSSLQTLSYHLLLTFCIVVISGVIKLMSTCSLSVLTLHHFKTISTTTQGWIPVPAFSVKYLMASYGVVGDVSCFTLSQLRSFTD